MTWSHEMYLWWSIIKPMLSRRQLDMHSPHIPQFFVRVLAPKKAITSSKTSRYSLLIPIPVTFFLLLFNETSSYTCTLGPKWLMIGRWSSSREANSASLFVLECCPLYISAPDFNCKWRSTRDPIFVFCYCIWWFFLFVWRTIFSRRAHERLGRFGRPVFSLVMYARSKSVV